MADQTQYSNGRDRISPTSKPQPGDLKMLMAQAVAFFPNQTLPPGTPDVYMLAWKQIADQYGAHRFQNALWNVLRRSDFFPLPKAIEDECEVLRRESWAGRHDEMIEYRDRLRNHPDEFISATDLMSEVFERVEARKRAKAGAA